MSKEISFFSINLLRRLSLSLKERHPVKSKIIEENRGINLKVFRFMVANLIMETENQYH